MTETIVAQTGGTDRPLGPSLRRGFIGRCPHCGKGHIFRAYLKVQDNCEVCGEAFHHHRADDAPPYVTMLIVTHILGFILVGVLGAFDEIPLWVHLTLWPALVLGLCLGLLPRVKGALVALQWALRMHGFGDPAAERSAAPSGA